MIRQSLRMMSGSVVSIFIVQGHDRSFPGNIDRRVMYAILVLLLLSAAALLFVGQKNPAPVMPETASVPQEPSAASDARPVVHPRAVVRRPIATANTATVPRDTPGVLAPESAQMDKAVASNDGLDNDLSYGLAATAGFADVVAVEVTTGDQGYEFNVTTVSADAGCDQYADWWEVVGEDGKLLYRRLLAQSHVGEQPFTRTSGTVKINAGTPVWVRAHMRPTGYGGRAMKGSAGGGFQPVDLRADFSASLATQPPLPSGCTH